MSNFKNSVKRNRTLALEARTLFDGSAIFDAALTLDADDGAEIAVYDAVGKSSVFEQAAKAAVNTVEASLLTANRDEIFSQFNAGLSDQSPEWNSAVDRLQSDMAQGKVAVGIAFLTDSQMDGQKGSFSAEGQDGNPAIFLNRDWIESGVSVSDIESVIADQLNEFIDSRLSADSSKELYFIDASLSDVQTLIDAVPAGADVYLVEAGVDGYAFMAETLAGQSGIAAIHVLGHGAVGEAQLGSVTLSDANLDAYAAELAVIGQSLTAQGDILLYGCNVAETGEGQAFIEQIASLTQADVAASDDVTGSGGDWELEVSTGSVESKTLSVDDYLGQLAGLEFADLSTWTAEGDSRARWILTEGSRTVFQTYNGSAMYYVSPEADKIDVAMKATIKQTDATVKINGTNYTTNYLRDDDVIGFVLGYKDANNHTLLYWYGEDSSTDLELRQYTNGSYKTLAKYDKDWVGETTIDFQLLYMNDSVKVIVDGVTAIDYKGTANQFSAGKFGFYNYSQGGVEYGNVQIGPGSTKEIVPTLQDDSYGTNTNTTLNVDKFNGLLANDYDANLDVFSIKVNGKTLTSDTSSTSFDVYDSNNKVVGRATVYGDGHFSYVPQSNTNGTGSFTYTLIDNDGESNSATVTLSTLAPNLAPNDISADSNTLSLSAKVNDTVANLTVSDPNVGDDHDILIVSQTVSGMFKVVDGVLKVADPTSLKADAVYSVKLRATDLRGLTYDETLTFKVAPDADGDGVSDANDIDDDGDGILDINESTENFKWASSYTISGNQLTGTIDGIGFTYTLKNTSASASNDNIATSAGIYDHYKLPSSYSVPNTNPAIANYFKSTNTIVFDTAILNPTLVFGSIGNSGTPVGITFSDDVTVEWQLDTDKVSGDVVTAGTQIIGREGYLIVKMKGEFTQLSFDYLDDETYANFAFGADVRQDVDTDGDGIVNRLDTDSDGDGVLDNVEAQDDKGYGVAASTLDNYVAPTGNDVDGDGLDDAYDRDTTTANKTRATESAGLTPLDSNSNGIEDYLKDEFPELVVGTLNSHDGTSSDLVVIAPNLTITDVENNDQISEAKVQINNLKSGDTLTFADTAAIKGSYNSATGVLTLTGQANSADYETALRSVSFSSSGAAGSSAIDTTDREFSFTIGSAIPFDVEVGGKFETHYYEFVTAKGITWDAAKAAAEARTLYGMQGYLATITSKEENTYVTSKLAGQGWFGASDAESEGIWKWVTGPEAGQQFWLDKTNAGTSSETFQGSPVNGMYSNWSSGEPNNADGSRGGEDVAHFYIDGTWNDYAATNTGSISGYIVEYGGFQNETNPTITGTATMHVNDAPVVENATSAAVTVTYTENDSAVPLAPTLVPSDIDDTTLHTATVVISSNAEAGDLLSLGATTGIGNITASRAGFSFDGNGDYLDLGKALDDGLTTEYTFETWVYWDPSQSNSAVDYTDFIFSNGREVNQSEYAELHTFGDSKIHTDGALGGLRFIAGTGVYIDVANVLPTETWTHVAVVYEKGVQGKIYVNGVDTNAAVTAGSVSTSFKVANDFNTFVGRRNDADSSRGVYFFEGQMDDIRVWDSARSASEIANNINSSLTGTESGLVGLYKASQTIVGSTVANLASGADAKALGDTVSSNTGASITLTSQGGTATLAEWQTALRSISYSSTNDSIQDQTKTVTWTVSDASLTSSKFNTSLVVKSVNDAPVINSSSVLTGSLTEADGTSVGTKEVNTSGVVVIGDPDISDEVVLSAAYKSISWTGGDYTQYLSATQIQTLKDGFVLAQTSALAVNSSSNQVSTSWSYKTNVDLNFLAPGETLDISFDVKATDTSGAESGVKTVTISIAGTQEPLSVADTTVFESDGYAKFEITNAQSRTLTLALSNGTATSWDGAGTPSLTSGKDDFSAVYEYRLDPTDDSSWVIYDKPFTTTATQSVVEVRVKITDDTVTDNKETFKLSVYESGTLVDEATATIYEPPAGLQIQSITTHEGAGQVNFKVVRDSGEGEATFTYTLKGDSASVGAGSNFDIDVSSLSGTASFAKGQTETTLSFAITNDSVFEGDESFVIELSDLNNLTLASPDDAKATATIWDNSTVGVFEGEGEERKLKLEAGADSDIPSLSIGDATVDEGGTLVFDVSLSNESKNPLKIKFTLADNTSNGSVDSNAMVVEAKTATGWGKLASKGGLYEVPAGAVELRVSAPTLNDSVYQGIQFCTLSATVIDVDIPQDYALVSNTGTGAIYDDGSNAGKDSIGTNTETDDRPTFSIADVTVNEGDKTATFTVTKEGSTALQSSVRYATVANSASSGGTSTENDFEKTQGILMFASGVTSGTITVAINNDDVYEGAESFYVELSDATNASIKDSQAIGTIIDDGAASGFGTDDDRPAFGISDVTVSEDAGVIEFTVTKTGSTLLESYVDYTFADGTAVIGTDVLGAAGTLKFGINETAKTIKLSVANDLLFERSENFTVNLSNAIAATISDKQATGTIVDDGIAGTDDDRPTFSVNDVTVSESAGTITFTVSKVGDTSLESEVSYRFSSDSALVGVDVTDSSGVYEGTLNFASNETSKSITLNVADDVLYEQGESFTIELYQAKYATISDDQGIGTIVDDGTSVNGKSDDDRPEFAIGDMKVSEDAGTISFTITKTGATLLSSSVDYGLADGTAVVGSDFIDRTDSVLFDPLETSKTIEISVIDDSVFEESESFTVNLASAVNATIKDAEAVGVIIDDGVNSADDDRPDFSVADVSVNESAGTITFRILKTGITDVESKVDYKFESGSAILGTDVTGTTSGTLTFSSNDTYKDVTLNVTDDTVFERSEEFTLTLSNASKAVISDATAIGSITDTGVVANGNIVGDDRPVFSINDVTVSEDAGIIEFTVTKTGNTLLESSVDYAFADGTAVIGTDVTGTAGTLKFGANETAKTIKLSVTNDLLFEKSENFTVNLSNAIDATISDDQGVGTISDDGSNSGDDDRPLFSVADVTVNEGAGTITFKVTKAGATSLASKVDYRFDTDSALVGTDVTATTGTALSGTLEFAADETVKDLTLNVTNDSIFELSESFTLSLSSAIDSVIKTSQAVGKIVDDGTDIGGNADDDTPSLSVADVMVEEGDGTLSFTVTRDTGSDVATEVEYEILPGSASLADDYTANDALKGTLVIGAGSAGTQAQITINIVDDNLFEASETVNIALTKATNATISDGEAVGTINVSDVPLSDEPFAIAPITVNEASDWAVFYVKTPGDNLAYDVTLSIQQETTILNPEALAYSIDGGANWIRVDNAAVPTIGSLPGSSNLLVAVDISSEQDLPFDSGEVFELRLAYQAGGADLVASGTATIVDDGTGVKFNLAPDLSAGDGGSTNIGLVDNRTTFAISDVVVQEGGNAEFTITRGNVDNSNISTDQTITVATSIASSDTAETTDFVATTETLTFKAGEESKTFTVITQQDVVFEQRESFTVTLSNNSVGSRIIDNTAQGLIVDDGTSGDGTKDDDRPSFSIEDVTINESAGTISFEVRKSGGTTLDSSVDYEVVEGTAKLVDDIVGNPTGTLSFSDSEVVQEITLKVIDDSIFESSENFSIKLKNASNATISVDTAIGSIVDDGSIVNDVSGDDRPEFSIADARVSEDAGIIEFTVTKTGLTDLASSVDFSFADGTAVIGTDLTGSEGTLTFAANETSKTIQLAIANDDLFEESESFTVNLSNAIDATISVAQATGTILDDGVNSADDDRPEFSVEDVTINESAGTITFKVSKSGATDLESEVDYKFESGSALLGTDVTNSSGTYSGTLKFASNETVKQITLDVTADGVFEKSESFTLTLSNSDKAVISVANSQAIGTLIDDASALTDELDANFDFGKITYNESTGAFEFVITNNGGGASGTTINYNVNPGAGALGEYFSDKLDLLSGSVTFGPNETTKVISIPVGSGFVYDGSEIPTVDFNYASDGRPTFSVQDVVVNEDNGTIDFLVTKSGATLFSSTVDYEINPETATLDEDYSGQVSSLTGTLSFGVNETSQLVSIAIVNDLVFEGAEKLTINLNAATDATISKSQAVGTIVDDGAASGFGADDDRPEFSISDVTVSEDDKTIEFTVTKSGSTALESSVDYSFADGTAQVGTDVIGTEGTLIFAANETAKTITLSVTDDAVFEESENFTVNLSNAVDAIIKNAQAVGTIVDDGVNSTDDDRPEFSVADVTVNESAGTITFKVNKNGETDLASTVDFNFASDSAIVGTDVTGTFSGTLEFAANEVMKEITLNITDDAVFENSESFILTLSNATKAIISDASAVGTITDNGTIVDGVSGDDRPSFSVNDVSVNETDGSLSFKISKDGKTALTSEVSYTLASILGITDSDFDSVNSVLNSTETLTFAAGETEKFVTLSLLDNDIFEGSEQLKITLSAAQNAIIADAEGVATIADQEDRKIKVSGLIPITNENSVYAAFRVDTIGADWGDLDFAVINGTAELVGIEGKPDPKVVKIADFNLLSSSDDEDQAFKALAANSADIRSFYVGVEIANEDDDTYEGLENFELKGSMADDASNTDSGFTLIVDDGTGARYDSSNVPDLRDSQNFFALDNDITGIDSAGRPQPTQEAEVVNEVVTEQVVIDYQDAFKEVKENLDAYGLADAIATEAQSQIDKLSGKIELYILDAVADARSDTVSLFRRLGADDSNMFMGSSVARSAISYDALAPAVTEIATSYGNDANLSEIWGGKLAPVDSASAIDRSPADRLVEVEDHRETEHQDFTSQLLAAANSQLVVGIARASAQDLASPEPANTELKESNS